MFSMFGRSTNKRSVVESASEEFQRLEQKIAGGKWSTKRAAGELVRFAERHAQDYRNAPDGPEKDELYRMVMLAALEGRHLRETVYGPS